MTAQAAEVQPYAEQQAPEHQDQQTAATLAHWEARLATLSDQDAERERQEIEHGTRLWVAEINAQRAKSAPARARPGFHRPAQRSASRHRRPAPRCAEGDDGPGEPAGTVHAFRVLDGLNVPQDYDESYMCDVALKLLRQASIELQETGRIARPHVVAWGVRRWILRDLVPSLRAKLTGPGMRFPCRCGRRFYGPGEFITNYGGTTLYCESCWNAGLRAVPTGRAAA